MSIPIFRKYKSNYLKDKSPFIKPTIIVYFREQYLIKLNKQRKQQNNLIHSINFYEHFWAETDKWGAACVFEPDDQIIYMAVFDRKGKGVTAFTHGVGESDLYSTDHLNQYQETVLKATLYMMHLVTESADSKKSVFTGQKNKCSLYELSQDEVKYVSVRKPKRIPSDEYVAPEAGSSGIKMREHDVHGHWRHYKNGAKVWVRPHKRGDPNLGKITKIFGE